jgi:hypothetical protein
LVVVACCRGLGLSATVLPRRGGGGGWGVDNAVVFGRLLVVLGCCEMMLDAAAVGLGARAVARTRPRAHASHLRYPPPKPPNRRGPTTQTETKPSPRQFVVPQLLAIYQEILGLRFKEDKPLSKAAWAPGVEAFKARARARARARAGSRALAARFPPPARRPRAAGPRRAAAFALRPRPGPRIPARRDEAALDSSNAMRPHARPLRRAWVRTISNANPRAGVRLQHQRPAGRVLPRPPPSGRKVRPRRHVVSRRLNSDRSGVQ